ncbi:hypothetical protein QTP86_002317 [Hemibagrus guttatus]|nr:hypothetical protein QTP86_002317 [Hemibagrus guttatus]
MTLLGGLLDLEKAYDRVPREELWYGMRKSGVAEKYIRVVQDMYERSRTVVRCAVGQTEEFKVEVGLHQGSALSPFLFAIVMDQLSEEVRQESPWTMMFADDIVICSESREQLEENLERWRFALERRGMKVSRSKTEYMCVNEREGSGTVRLQGEEVKKVQEFKYLGSTVQSNGECGKEAPLSQECVRALMKQTYCPHCREMVWAKPCAPYCRNVMKGCLANQADLDTEWKNLADAMLMVADRLSRPYNVDAAILSLPKRIADAIIYMQDNLNTFNNKVFQACGTPPENPNPEEPKKRGETFAGDVSRTSATSAEKLLSDISRKIRNMMQYWIQLPTKLCVDREAKGSDENKCWNGMAVDRYLPDVMGDGLANQINNPEVEIDITKPDMTIRQQIMQLKIMTSRMKNAINGNDVDFQDAIQVNNVPIKLTAVKGTNGNTSLTKCSFSEAQLTHQMDQVLELRSATKTLANKRYDLIEYLWSEMKRKFYMHKRAQFPPLAGGTLTCLPQNISESRVLIKYECALSCTYVMSICGSA